MTFRFLRIPVFAGALGFALMMGSGCEALKSAAAVAPAHVELNVRMLGAVGDGQTKDTAVFQKAIDEAAQTGENVVVPAGTYLVGSLELKSNTTLRLEEGANLLGSPDLDDYPITKIRWEGRLIDGHRGLIFASKAQNIAVTGPGKITGSPKLGGRAMPRMPVLIEPMECNDVRLTDFSTMQQKMWSIHPTFCENVTAKNLVIRSTGGNGDGIDVDSSKHVHIEGCDIETGDDCVAIKSGRGMEGYKMARPTEDVTIINCTLSDSIFACIGIGSETSGGISGVRIEHCTFKSSKTFSIYIKSHIGRGAGIQNITASDLKVESATGGFLRLNLTGSGLSPASDPPVPGDEGIPFSRNFSFSNVKINNCATLVDARMLSPVKPLEGLRLTNITGTCKKGIALTNIKDAALSGIDVNGYSGKLLTVENVTGTGLEGAGK